MSACQWENKCVAGEKHTAASENKPVTRLVPFDNQAKFLGLSNSRTSTD